MARPRNLKAPEKILRIETDDRNFTPIEQIPEEYRNLIIPSAGVFYTHDYDFDMVCQCIRLGDFSLWMHEIFAMEAITLLPVTCKEIIALHFMAGGGTEAEIAENGPYQLSGKEVNLFKLNALFHEAPMKKGDAMFSFHINVLPETLPKLGKKYPELEQLANKKLMKGSGALHDKPYKINLVCYNLIKDICDCKYIEMLADKFLFRCCLDLFINFANQDKVAHLPNISYTTEMQQILKEAVKYMMDEVEEEFNLSKIAYNLDVNAQELKVAFENTYNISMEAFDQQRKMIHAFKLTVGTKSTPEEIGQSIAMNDDIEFIHLFESYFDCSFIAVRNAQ
jgi:AraC-like DNA-binding protein